MIKQEDIKEIRLSRGIKSCEMCSALNIASSNYSNIENCKRTVSESLLKEIDFYLNTLWTNDELTCIFDYLRIRFTYTEKNLNDFLEKILRIDLNLLVNEGKGFYGYKKLYRLGNIKIMVDDTEEKGILLELSGKGCREFETILKFNSLSWFDFFLTCVNEECTFKRIDLAIDDRLGYLNVPYLIKKFDDGEVRTKFKAYRSYKAGELNSSLDDRLNQGNTLYIGSFSSEIYFCIYEKDYEQYLKNGIPFEECKVKNRFEIRLRNERAIKFVEYYLGGYEICDIALGIINEYMAILKPSSKNKRYWKITKDWEMFLNGIEYKLKLTTEPKKFDIENTYSWLFSQVSPTLSMCNVLDRYFNTNHIEKMINNKLPDKQKEIIKQIVETDRKYKEV